MSRTQISVDSRKLLVDRIAASRYVGKSARLRTLLLYLCDQVLEHQAQEIHEQEVGHAVFGRPANYDTISDNIVRVHASTLRKRLEQYFSSEGRDEPVIIELPKGNYAPVFLERRHTEVVPSLEPVAPQPLPLPVSPLPLSPPGNSNRRLRNRYLAALAILFACLSLALLLRDRTMPVTGILTSKQSSHGLWSQIFAAGSNTDIVLDDEGVGLYQELTGTHIALSDYFNRNYLRSLGAAAAEKKVDPEALGTVVLKRQSSYASATLLWKLGAIADESKSGASIHFARDYSFRELQVNNAVLIGTALSNPWIEAFQDRLGLRWRPDASRGSYYPVDTWSQTAGSGERYRTTDEGYAMVAVVPNLSGTGIVLILSSSGGSAMNAAAEFLSSNESVARLTALLPHTQKGKLPRFEALLKMRSRSRLTRDTSIVICRPSR